MDTPKFNRSLPGLALLLVSCASQGSTDSGISSPALREEVLTAEEQAALTPYEVIELLRQGNQRFVRNDLTLRDHSAMVRRSAGAQYPKAIVLSCVDSRVPVEDVFDRGIGDVFVARVAGNFVNPDILGSMEFACGVSGAKLILVMGHEHCGAVKAAIDGVEVGNITGMLARIRPAVEAARASYGGAARSDNEELDDAPESAHVKRTAQEEFEPEAFVVRRSMPWADATQEGLVFVAFGRSFDAFEAQLIRMSGAEDGVVDALFRFTRPVTGGYFWCPPVKDGKLDLTAMGM